LTQNTENSPGAETLLARAALFGDLPPSIIQSISEISGVRRFGAGETIFSPGQFDGAELLYVASGCLRAVRADPASGSMVVELIAPGGCFALVLAVLSADVAQFSSLTLSTEAASEVVFIDADAFRALVAQRPLLARCLLMHFALASIATGEASAEEAAPDRRVFAAIAALVRRDAATSVWRIEKMPKHRDLADLAKVGESDAASAVARLISSGVARRDYPGLVIDDMVQLNRLAR